MLDEGRLISAISRVTGTEEKNGIGTLSEKPLHKILKYYFEPDESKHEIKVFDSVADVFDGNEIFEIQTGGFLPLVKKLKKTLNPLMGNLKQNRPFPWYNNSTKGGNTDEK